MTTTLRIAERPEPSSMTSEQAVERLETWLLDHLRNSARYEEREKQWTRPDTIQAMADDESVVPRDVVVREWTEHLKRFPDQMRGLAHLTPNETAAFGIGLFVEKAIASLVSRGLAETNHFDDVRLVEAQLTTTRRQETPVSVPVSPRSASSSPDPHRPSSSSPSIRSGPSGPGPVTPDPQAEHLESWLLQKLEAAQREVLFLTLAIESLRKTK